MNTKIALLLSTASLLAVWPAIAEGQPPKLLPPAPPPSATPRSAAVSPAAKVVITTLQEVCLPVLKGAPLSSAAKSAGFTESGGEWTLKTAGSPEVVLEPPDTANPHVCAATIELTPADSGPIGPSVAAWAMAQSPPLTPVKSDVVAAGKAFQRVTWSWSGRGAAAVEGVVLSREQPLPGYPGRTGEATLFVSLTPA
jgi:hypothetical protein